MLSSWWVDDTRKQLLLVVFLLLLLLLLKARCVSGRGTERMSVVVKGLLTRGYRA